MRKIILLFLALFVLIESKEYSINIYTIEIDVNSTKADGKSWDIAGGSPDILLYVDGKEIPFNPKCRDKYRCSIEFIVKNGNNSWYFEIYDKDFTSNDLIGKGECTLGKECQLGRAKISIKE